MRKPLDHSFQEFESTAQELILHSPDMFRGDLIWVMANRQRYAGLEIPSFLFARKPWTAKYVRRLPEYVMVLRMMLYYSYEDFGKEITAMRRTVVRALLGTALKTFCPNKFGFFYGVYGHFLASRRQKKITIYGVKSERHSLLEIREHDGPEYKFGHVRIHGDFFGL